MSRTAIGFALLLTIELSAAIVVAADPPRATEIEGTWTLDLSQESNLKGSQDKPNLVTLVFEADSWKLSLVNDGGSQEVVGGYAVDAAQTPKLLDVTVRRDDGTQDIFAIYALEKDKLTIGWRPDGARPADLAGTVFDGLLKVSFLRKRAE